MAGEKKVIAVDFDATYFPLHADQLLMRYFREQYPTTDLTPAQINHLRMNFFATPGEIERFIEQELTPKQREHLELSMHLLNMAQKAGYDTAIFTNSRYPGFIKGVFNYLLNTYPEQYSDFSLQNHAYVFGYTALLNIPEHEGLTVDQRYAIVLKSPEVSKVNHAKYYQEEYPFSSLVCYDDNGEHVNRLNQFFEDKPGCIAHLFPKGLEAIKFLKDEIAMIQEEFEEMKREALRAAMPVVAPEELYDTVEPDELDAAAELPELPVVAAEKLYDTVVPETGLPVVAQPERQLDDASASQGISTKGSDVTGQKVD